MLLLALLALTRPAGGAFEVRSAGKPPAPADTLSLTADFVSARRTGQPRPGWPRTPQLVLANGDRMAATVVGGDGRAVWVQTAYTGGNDTDRLVIPLAAVAAVWLVPPPADTPPDPARYPWADGPKRTDAVLLADGDVRRGVVESVTAAGVKLGKAGLLSAARVQAVAFDPSLGRVRPTAGRHYRAVLADGSRLTLAAAAVENDTVRARLAAGPAVTLPVNQLVALDVVGGPAAYLSDRKPLKQTTEGYTGGSGWPLAADRTVRGRPLQVGPDTFDKGLGTHPRTVLVYKLDGKHRRFEATVGIDPVTGRGGAATARVLADGKDVSPAGLKQLGTEPVTVSADVTGAKELTLEVGYGPFGGVRADVNWGDAKLIE